MPFTSLRNSPVHALIAGSTVGLLILSGLRAAPCSSSVTRQPSANRAVALQLARQNVQDREMVAGLRGSLRRVVLPPSPLLNHKRIAAWIYLPPGYANSTARYPVAYLLHGAPGEARDWWVDAKAQRVAETLIEKRMVKPLILVAHDAFGPGGVNDVQNYLDRADGTYAMESFTVQALVPWVDAHFRTRARAASRALVGFSAGGYGAANLGFKYPGVWKVSASVAGFFDPGDDAAQMTRLLGPKSKRWDDNSPLLRVRELPRGMRLHFYMDCGRSDPLFHEFKKMQRELKARGADYEVQELDGDHAWDYLHARLFDVLKFCDRRWRELSVSGGGAA